MSARRGPSTAEELFEYIARIGIVHLHGQGSHRGKRWILVMSKTKACGTKDCFGMRLVRKSGVAVSRETTKPGVDPGNEVP